MSGGDSGEPIPKDSCAEEEREALILLQVDDVVVNEVKGQKREKLDQGTLTALKIAATEEELKELGCQVATEFSQENSEVVFVIISDHKIPIIRNVPIIRKEPHKYTFLLPGLFLEIVMPDDVDDEEIEILELIFTQNGVFRIKGETVVDRSTVTVNQQGERAEPSGSVGDRVGKGIEFVGQKVIGGLEKATPAVQGGIGKGSDFAKGKVTPNEVPTEVKNKQAIREARLATKTAVIVSGQMANAMVGLARTIGSRVGGMVGGTQAGQRLDEGPGAEVKKVATTGITTAAQVIDAGTTSVKSILTSVCEGVSDVVGHKYGDEAGEACRDGLGCVEDVVSTGLNLKQVGVKGLAKAAGKQAAKDALKEGNGSEPSPSS